LAASRSHAQSTAATQAQTQSAAPSTQQGDAPRRSSLGQAARVGAPAAYVPKNNVVEIDISEYAGYGGLIVANGRPRANPDSSFAKEVRVPR
jgi:NitT/TauT family transport system substrate-binding protein